jgi:hypothetical protein
MGGDNKASVFPHKVKKNKKEKEKEKEKEKKLYRNQGGVGPLDNLELRSPSIF